MADLYGVVILQGHLRKSSKNQGCVYYRSQTEPLFSSAHSFNKFRSHLIKNTQPHHS